MTSIIKIPEMAEVLTVTPRPRDQNPAYVYLMHLPARSGRLSQAQVIKKMAEWLGGTPEVIEWGNLRYPHTTALRTRVIEAGYSPASARKFMSAIRGIMLAARRLGQIPTTEYVNAVDLDPIGGKSLPAGRYIPEDEIKKIFDNCLSDKSAHGARDAALFALMYGCGLRREEVTTLDYSDYHPQEGRLIVHGKRNKDRIAYVTNGTEQALQDWIKYRGEAPGPLFLAVYKHGNIRQDERLSPQAIYNAVILRARAAGIEHFSPHSLRRSFCSKLLEAGVDISTVSDLAGHESISTTQLYDRRGEVANEKGALLLQIPYKR